MKTQTLISDIPRYEKTEIGLLLATIGGFLDAYTFLNYGGVFANAQTGNMVLLGIALVQGDFSRISYYLLPILAFIVGVLFTEYIEQKLSRRVFLNNYQFVLTVELLLLLLIPFLPGNLPNSVVTIAISFISSLQINSFRRICGTPFTSTMCTGNLRSSAEQLYLFLCNHDQQALWQGLRYLLVIVCFCVGAALSAFTSRLWGVNSLFVCCAILMLLLLLPMRDLWRRAA